MEADFASNGIFREDSFEADGNGTNQDNLVIEGERCGICMDIIIDRGVLDSCQHWFCFVCIDNWATITNLCPLCQKEFQLITCVPVYDTIGSNKVEDESVSTDDDWSIEGKNNTLSFPSYYIDENAVICLDGDGCKIRCGSTTIVGDSSVDTSIACDSCDIWYHAFCVGFDPEGTSEITWLCPRCVVDEVPKRINTNSIDGTDMECNPENGNSESRPEESFSGKLSVSVADTGETAVVVSMVEGNQCIPASSEKGLSPSEVDEDPMTESYVSISDSNNHQREIAKLIISPIVEDQELELSLSHNVSCNLTSNSLVHNDLKTSPREAKSEPISYDGNKLFNESNFQTCPSRNESNMGIHLGLSVGSFLSVDCMDKNETKDLATDVQQLTPDEFMLKGDEFKPNALKDDARVTGRKRKYMSDSNDQAHATADDRDIKPQPEVEVLQKNIRADGSQLSGSKGLADAPVSDNAPENPTIAAVSRDDNFKHCPIKENVTSDIMSIVKGTNLRVSKGLAGPNGCDVASKRKEDMAGLRVKKIMKRASDDGESSLVVQNLRKQIREAVHNKSSQNFGEHLFDPNLLAAFRAAIAGPKTEPVNKLSPSAVKAKKSMLQKGKVREHLTKKIFATSNGRRKRAWDRDCEIEFWKYRCMRTTKPEKIETLNSVLDLLRQSSQNPESKQNAECQAKDPILSRLYLADTSVFPRKDDVKPLSALKTAANTEQSKQQPSGKGSKSSLDYSNTKTAETNDVLSKAGACSSQNKVKKIVHGSDSDNLASGKAHLGSHSEGTSTSTSGGSKVCTKQLSVKSDSMKSDKRKWALEVLARKTAAAGGKSANENQEGGSMLKGNYPLLAQLPADMRPVLAPGRHNKIPISVRQTQLYRLTEHFLRKTHLTVICRTADTELAVADAVNIEKEVADRSNSKLVYLNLCSQELLHRSNNKKSNGPTDTNPLVSSEVLTDRLEENAEDLSTDPAVEIALKNAGLLSDSPPSSPHEKRENNEDDISGPDNIFELNSHPELDIYGDFEYDLGDEDYIGASVANVSNPQEGSESKMKLVFSTMNLKMSDIALDNVDCERSGNKEMPRGASSSPTCHDDVVHRIIDAESGKPSATCEPILGEGGAEPSDAEFEELYGPDKEPLSKKIPDGESRTLHEEGKTETSTKDIGNHNEETRVSDPAVNTSEFGNKNFVEIVSGTTIADNLSNPSDISENFQRKEDKSDTAAKQSDSVNQVSRKVEAYIKEHIRPLCKSSVITAEQYRWAVAKTTDKVMKYHCKAKNAHFLIKEGEKVKKLAEQYVEAAQQNRKC